MKHLVSPLAAFLRILWAAPCSILGVVIAIPVLVAGGSSRRVGRTIEFSLYRTECPTGAVLRQMPFSAITFGHIIIGISGNELERLRSHEQVHVQQYERLGSLFLLAYPASSLLALLRGRCPYRHNRYEIEACRHARAREHLA